MSDTDDSIESADQRYGEGATDWTETDRDEARADGGPVPPDAPELDQQPDAGQLPSDSDVQAERQPGDSGADRTGSG
jgi:hypothetical protein